MATYKQKTPYALNFDADKKVLRAEFNNAIQPALDQALAELAHRHSEIETQGLPPKRLASAFDEVQQLAETGMRRMLAAKTDAVD